MSKFEHLGMRWTGATRDRDGRRILLAENIDSHRVWAIDPETGIGEPLACRPGGAAAGQTVAARQPPTPQSQATTAPVHRDPVHRDPMHQAPPVAATAGRARRGRGSGGPFVCDHCGETSLYRLRFSGTEFVTKCLRCRRFVVDGKEERPGKPRRAPKKGTSLWLPLGETPADDVG